MGSLNWRIWGQCPDQITLLPLPRSQSLDYFTSSRGQKNQLQVPIGKSFFFTSPRIVNMCTKGSHPIHHQIHMMISDDDKVMVRVMMTIMMMVMMMMLIRVAEVAREHGWPPPKSLDSDENFKPKRTLFRRELRFVAIYALFGNLWAKKCLLGQKQCFLGKKYTITWYILHISLS